MFWNNADVGQAGMQLFLLVEDGSVLLQRLFVWVDHA